MTDERVSAKKRRRTLAEIEQVVNEFASSGLNRSQFCRQQGLTLGTLNRYLQKLSGDSASVAPNTALVAVELTTAKLGVGPGLTVLLANHRRIEVGAGFDENALRHLVQVLETL
jgi:hypothetical protein